MNFSSPPSEINSDAEPVFAADGGGRSGRRALVLEFVSFSQEKKGGLHIVKSKQELSFSNTFPKIESSSINFTMIKNTVCH